MDSITILAPAFNEEDNIIPFVEHFHPKLKKDWNLLIINDGSNDRTLAKLREIENIYPKLNFNSHKTNLGLGKAFETGFKLIKTDYVITIDCDLSHKFDVVDELFKNRHKADVVIAAMSNPGSSYSEANLIRVIIAKIGNYLISKLLGVKIKEVAGGPRIYKASKIKNLNIEYSGFEAQVEIIKKLSASGCTFGECALFLEKRLYGESKMNYILTILGVLKILLTK